MAPVHHGHEHTLRDTYRDAHVDLTVIRDAVRRVTRVQLRVLHQGEGHPLYDDVVHRDAHPSLFQLTPDRLRLVHEDIHGDAEVRDVLP